MHFQLLGWLMGPVYVPTVDMTQYMQQTANIVMGLSLRGKPSMVSVDQMGQDLMTAFSVCHTISEHCLQFYSVGQ